MLFSNKLQVLYYLTFFIHSCLFLCDLGFVSFLFGFFFFFFWWESYRIITPFGFACGKTWVSLVAQLVKNPPAKQTQVQSMDGEDPLEKGMATHSSILAWKIPLTEEPGGLLPMWLQKSETRLSDYTTTTTMERFSNKLSLVTSVLNLELYYLNN